MDLLPSVTRVMPLQQLKVSIFQNYLNYKKAFQWDANRPLANHVGRGGEAPSTVGSKLNKSDMSGGPCKVRYILNKFEHVRRGPCMVRSNASWVMPPPSWTNRQTRLKHYLLATWLAGGNEKTFTFKHNPTNYFISDLSDHMSWEPHRTHFRKIFPILISLQMVISTEDLKTTTCVLEEEGNSARNHTQILVML